MDGGASSLIKDPFCPVIIGAGIADFVPDLFLQERAVPLRKIPIPMAPFIPGTPVHLDPFDCSKDNPSGRIPEGDAGPD